MTQAVSPELIAPERSAAECVMIQDLEGNRFGFSTWDESLTIDMGTGQGPEVFARGMTLGSLTLAVGTDASFFEFSGPLGDALTRVDVNGGRYKSALAWLFKISPDGGNPRPLLKGSIRENAIENGAFVFEVRGEADRLNQRQGRRISNLCSADFGDAKCGQPLVPVAATVTSVTNDLSFGVSFVGTFADDYFNRGEVDFLTGDLANVAAIDIEDFAGGTNVGTVELFVPFFKRPEIGDTLTLSQGCSKLRKSDDPSLPTCMSYGNILNYRGFPETPGSEILKYQVPGGPGA